MAARPGMCFPTMPSFAGTDHWRNHRGKLADRHRVGACGRFQPYYTKDGGVTWSPVVLPGVTDWSDF